MTAARHIALRRAGAGPRIVLLHGWGMTGLAMAPLSERLGGAETLAPDLPGHGETRGYSADLGGAGRMLDDLLQDGRPSLLVGWSLGALVGWQRIARNPAGIAGLVSLDMSPRPAPDWEFGMISPFPETGPSTALWTAGARAIVQSLFAGGRPPGSVAGLTRLVAAQNPKAMAQFWASLIKADCRDALAHCPVPLLALHGAQSRVYPPETGAYIARSAPRAKMHLLDGAGHAPHLERPEITADLIADFARKVLSR